MTDEEGRTGQATDLSRRHSPTGLRRFAAGLMVLSGVTHVAQLAVYGAAHSVVGAALFGAVYFVIGLFLWGRGRIALILGAVLPAIGGALGVVRFLYVQPNPFSVFHVAIDLLVVPVCVYLLVRGEACET